MHSRGKCQQLLRHFFVCWAKEREVVSFRCILGLCPVGMFDMGVRLILKFLWLLVIETLESIENIGEHGEVHYAVAIVPIPIQSNIASSLPVAGYGVVIVRMVMRWPACCLPTFITQESSTQREKEMGC